MDFGAGTCGPPFSLVACDAGVSERGSQWFPPWLSVRLAGPYFHIVDANARQTAVRPLPRIVTLTSKFESRADYGCTAFDAFDDALDADNGCTLAGFQRRSDERSAANRNSALLR